MALRALWTANGPTLTSNPATLGWGTLAVRAAVKVAARLMCLPAPPAFFR
jgi:hypothetical protein